MGQPTQSMTMLEAKTSSMTPPRPRRVLKRMPRSVPEKMQLEMTMLRTPPVVSLPKATAEWPRCMVQLVIVTFSQGCGLARRSSSLPDLMAMQSSPTSMWHSEMWTLEQESMSMPSVLGESGGLMMERRARVTLSQATGTTAQAPELLISMFSMRTLRQLTRRMRREGKWSSCLRRLRSHQSEPLPSILPRPVMAMFSRFSPAMRPVKEGGELGPSHWLVQRGYLASSGMPRRVAPASR